MLGLPNASAAVEEAVVVAKAPKAPRARTMLGLAPPAAEGAPPPSTTAPPASEAERPVAGDAPSASDPALRPELRTGPAGGAASRRARSNATMMGMPAAKIAPTPPGSGSIPLVSGAPSSATSPAPAPVGGDPLQRTLLGMAPPAAPSAPLEASSSAVEPRSEPEAPALATAWSAEASPRAIASSPPYESPAPDVASPAIPERSDRPPAVFSTPNRPRAQVTYDVEEDSSPSLPVPRTAWLGVSIAALVALGAVVGIGFFLLGDRGLGLAASIAHDETGEVLILDVPAASPGTRVRFAGEERAVEEGSVRFALSPEDLRLGTNHLAVDRIGPDGTVEHKTVTLSLDFRVRPSLERLAEDPAALEVIVEAREGIDAFVDEAPVTLDAHGHGKVAIPVEVAEGDEGTSAFERKIRYRAIGGERPLEGVLHVRVPFASLQLDRPGKDLVTDATTVEIAGAVHPKAQVTIDGLPVRVQEGRFVHRKPLDGLGEHRPVIVVRQPERAPRRKVILIRRVASIAEEAGRFQADPSVTYARLEQNPEIYRGRSVAFEGRVYNVEVSGGRSVLQVLVKTCPPAKRCPLWVTYPAATDTTAQSWVRVLGTAAGEQQFRSESGRILSVPRVDAEFVLPASGRGP